jgi:hypothetical protein
MLFTTNEESSSAEEPLPPRRRGPGRSKVPKTGLPAWMDRSAEHAQLMALPRVGLSKRTIRGTEYWYYSWEGRPFHGSRSLGSNPVVALKRYKEYEAHRAGPDALRVMDESKIAVRQYRALAREAVDIIRLLVGATEPKPKPGVYFLLGRNSEIVYVGQSDNVLVRMRGHDDKEFDCVRMIHMADQAKRGKLETRLINLLTPPLNIRAEGTTKAILETEEFTNLPRLTESSLFKL